MLGDRIAKTIASLCLLVAFLSTGPLSENPGSWASDPPDPASPHSSPSVQGTSGDSASFPGIPAEVPLSLYGPDALSAYQHSWNPLTAGPHLVSYADTLPEGVFNARFFFYTRFTQAHIPTAEESRESLPDFTKPSCSRWKRCISGSGPIRNWQSFLPSSGRFHRSEEPRSMAQDGSVLKYVQKDWKREKGW